VEGNAALLAALWAFALAGHAPLEGSYVATSLNGRSVPTMLRLPVQGGDFRLFRLEQGVLRLSSGGRFTLSFRYYHQLVRHGKQPVNTPVLSDSESGTYRLEGGKLILTPVKKPGEKTRPTIAATLDGEKINAAYVLQSGSSQERISLTLKRDPTFW
jgi:hypothetical protein